MLSSNTLPRGVLILYGIFISVSAQTCYYPDGSVSPSDTACNSSATNSGCCGEGAWCMDNGLCYVAGILSRGSCTDSSWGDDCPSYCSTYGTSGGFGITPCGSGYFGCGVNNTACIDSTDTFEMADGTDIILRAEQVEGIAGSNAVAMKLSPSTNLTVSSASSTASSTASAQTVTVTASATGAAFTPSAKSGGFTAGDLAGAAVGVGAPLLLALAGALFMLHRQRKATAEAEARNSNSGAPDTYDNGHMQSPAPQYGAAYFSDPPTAAPKHTMGSASELDAYGARQELDSNPKHG